MREAPAFALDNSEMRGGSNDGLTAGYEQRSCAFASQAVASSPVDHALRHFAMSVPGGKSESLMLL